MKICFLVLFSPRKRGPRQEERAATEQFWDELEGQLPEILDYKINR
jgi:hypothetical protein